MLLQFTLTNFFSLRDQAVVDMRASNARSFRSSTTAENTFAEEGVSLLKTVAVFGANASGKSNLLKAIEVALGYIKESHNYTELTSPRFIPFKFGNQLQPSSFEMEVVIDGEKYEYGFSVLSKRIVEEHLYFYPKKYKALIFKREYSQETGYTYTFSKKFTRPKEVSANTSEYTLLLTRAALMSRPEAVKILNFVTNRIVFGLPSFDDSDFEQLLRNNKDKIIDALIHADSDIVDYEFKANPSGAGRRLVTYHKGNIDKPFDFDTEESAGTRRLLRLIGAFIDVAENGKILIIDELETSLHSQLVKYAVKIFNMSDRAQLIFSTHDLNLLDVGLLRPDQIYFASKDYTNGSSEIYSLADFVDYRSYKNLRRDYEQGRFDAIPILPSI